MAKKIGLTDSRGASVTDPTQPTPTVLLNVSETASTGAWTSIPYVKGGGTMLKARITINLASVSTTNSDTGYVEGLLTAGGVSVISTIAEVSTGAVAWSSLVDTGYQALRGRNTGTVGSVKIIVVA